MAPRKQPLDPARRAQILAELRRDLENRQKSYRERALALFPHVCARCGREFSAKRLRELTVHHRDHNYKNNPPDGSNWELLCLYCHDNEHEQFRLTDYTEEPAAAAEHSAAPIANPFAQLDNLLQNKTGDEAPEKKSTTDPSADHKETP